MFIKAIEEAIASSSYKNQLSEIMNYAVLPAGKLFRPRLVEAIALDLETKLKKDHIHLGVAIELHHAYTLVHDDLPSMDNDSIRRGKPSTHAQFGEWKAILTGDALLIASFNELAKINHLRFKELLHLMTWTTGAKGLVDGQFRDLDSNGNLPIQEVVRIHELKTGRLIQLATLGTYLLNQSVTFRGKIEFLRLGRNIGVTFQLLDDLCELTSKDVSPHEMKINPFIHSPKEAHYYLKSSHDNLIKFIKRFNLHHTQKMLDDYFQSNKKLLQSNLGILKGHLKSEVEEIENWITNFS